MIARADWRLLGALGSLSLVACSAVLGFEPLSFDPSVGTDAGTAKNDAGGITDGSTTTDGSSANDGGVGDGAPGQDASCTETDHDPLNCGRCGHDCAGGECDAGVCQPGKLADSLAVPAALVVDDTQVYVAEHYLNRIIKLDKNKVPGNCNSTSTLVQCAFAESPGAFQPRAMAIDADNVYWSNDPVGGTNEIRSCPRTGCAGSGARLIATLGSDVLVTDVKVSGGIVYWAENNGSAIRRAQPDGGAPRTLLENSSYSPLHIAVDDAYVFFTEDGNNQPGPTSIRAVQVDGGGAPRAIAEAKAKTHGITLTSNGDVFWTVPFVGGVGDGYVEQSSKTATGQAPTGSFASNQVEPAGIVADDTNVYWLQSGSDQQATGQVVYCPIAGCPSNGPVVLADHQAYPRYIAQDDKAIYWSNEGLASSQSFDGQVWKVAKP